MRQKRSSLRWFGEVLEDILIVSAFVACARGTAADTAAILASWLIGLSNTKVLTLRFISECKTGVYMDVF